MIAIRSRSQLVKLAVQYGLREDWHEPDEQEIEAYPAIGHHFDNAVSDYSDFEVTWARRQDEYGIHATVFQVLPRVLAAEHGVFIFHRAKPVAFVNLADLLAMACGFDGYVSDDEEE